MSDEHDDKHFSVDKVFIWLFIFTAAEVAWGYLAHGWGRPLLWGGLLLCAAWKGFLIAAYFMHLKFEGWIVKVLIFPTPFLILVIMGYVQPDVGSPDHLLHPVGSMYDPENGSVNESMRAMDEAAEAEDGGGH